MPFLPEEFSRAEEHAGTHLPAHYVCPLVAKQRKVAIAVNPVFICAPDNGFRRRTHNQLLFQTSIGVNDDTVPLGVVFQTIVCDNSTLFGKTLNMLRFTAKKRFRYQQRKIGVLHSGLLKHFVKSLLHFLPYRIAIRLNHHTATHGALFGQIGFYDKLVIPFRIVLTSFCEIF